LNKLNSSISNKLQKPNQALEPDMNQNDEDTDPEAEEDAETIKAKKILFATQFDIAHARRENLKHEKRIKTLQV
jgi:hypothetical protein